MPIPHHGCNHGGLLQQLHLSSTPQINNPLLRVESVVDVQSPWRKSPRRVMTLDGGDQFLPDDVTTRVVKITDKNCRIWSDVSTGPVDMDRSIEIMTKAYLQRKLCRKLFDRMRHFFPIRTCTSTQTWVQISSQTLSPRARFWLELDGGWAGLPRRRAEFRVAICIRGSGYSDRRVPLECWVVLELPSPPDCANTRKSLWSAMSRVKTVTPNLQQSLRAG